MFAHRGEVAILVYQAMTMLDAKSPYNEIDGFPDGYTFRSKDTVIPGCCDGQIGAGHSLNPEASQPRFHTICVRVILSTL